MSKVEADTEGRNARKGRIERKPFRTTFRFEPTGEESWKATERDGEKDCWGRGKTPHDAVANYAMLMQNGDYDE